MQRGHKTRLQVTRQNSLSRHDCRLCITLTDHHELHPVMMYVNVFLIRWIHEAIVRTTGRADDRVVFSPYNSCGNKIMNRHTHTHTHITMKIECTNESMQNIGGIYPETINYHKRDPSQKQQYIIAAKRQIIYGANCANNMARGTIPYGRRRITAEQENK